jgi:hypothetical protein
MSILMPKTPDKNENESSSVRSVPFSIPDSLSSFFGENGALPSLASSLHSGEGSTWQNRDVILFFKFIRLLTVECAYHF